MGLRLYSLLLCFFLTACSVYRSDGRKEFESLNFSSASVLSLGCETSASSSAEIQKSLHQRHYSFVELDEDRQLWSKNLDPHIVAHLLVPSQNPVTLCTWAFEDQQAWQQHSQEIFLSLPQASNTQ